MVGDTIEFDADLVLSPVHKVFRTFLSFADSAGRQGSVFHQRGAELAETKATARGMVEWMGDATSQHTYRSISAREESRSRESLRGSRTNIWSAIALKLKAPTA
jgi:hypothetical protein